MPAATSIVFSSFGVTAEVVIEDPARVDAVCARLPPDWQRADLEPRAIFTLTDTGTVLANGKKVTPLEGREDLDALESAVCAEIAAQAPDYVFVHAGVVARHGQAIVLPGATMAGKSTIVAALVAAGAEYYSDEYAVLDQEGRVHPYARPLALRTWPEMEQRQVAVQDLGGVIGRGAANVAVVAALRFRFGGSWRPAKSTSADGALALLSQTIPVRERPGQAVAVVRRAVEGAIVIEGARGEADEAATMLLGVLEDHNARA